METSTIVIVVVIVIVLAVLAYVVSRQQSRRHLEDQFGPEYDRTVTDADNRRQAEQELKEREERRQDLDIRPLEPEAHDRYQSEWHDLQQRFVDEPKGAVIDADRLVTDVMRDRGYPVEDFERQASDISVDHPRLVEDYRSAHDIALRVREDRADTEDLRQAVIHYRSLFDDLLDGRRTT